MKLFSREVKINSTQCILTRSSDRFIVGSKGLVTIYLKRDIEFKVCSEYMTEETLAHLQSQPNNELGWEIEMKKLEDKAISHASEILKLMADMKRK